MEKKKRKYRRLRYEDRLYIEALLNAGHSCAFIGTQLGFSARTIQREVKRGLYWHRNGQTWIDEQRKILGYATPLELYKEQLVLCA